MITSQERLKLVGETIWTVTGALNSIPMPSRRKAENALRRQTSNADADGIYILRVLDTRRDRDTALNE